MSQNFNCSGCRGSTMAHTCGRQPALIGVGSIRFSPEGKSDIDWPEDFNQENGQYQNTCHTCGVIFLGHKGRITCKKCSTLKGKSDG